MRLWHDYTGYRPYHRAAGRLVSLLLALLLSVSALAEEADAPVLTALYNPEYPAPLVPEHEPAGDEYFADAVFIGDSMMEYVEMLGELPTANYVWNIGMSPMSVSRKQFRVKGTNTRLSTWEKAAEYSPRKLYIMLGSNGLDNYGVKIVVEDYERLADAAITHFPEALIYVITPPPMSHKRMREEKTPAKRYVDFAAALKELAARRNFYYIDLYSLLANEDGYLPGKYDAGDGFHLSNKAYSLLIEQARKQTVPYPVPATEGENVP